MSVVAGKPDHPKFKKWIKSRLKPEDYDFIRCREWPRYLLGRIWLWEIDRELGSRKPAFLACRKCNSYTKQLLKTPSKAHSKKPLIQHYTFRDLLPLGKRLYWDGFMEGTTPWSTIHPIEIDWSATKGKIVDAFRKSLAEFHPPITRRGGSLKKPAQFLARLTHLAAYRLEKAGIQATEDLPDGFTPPMCLDSKTKSPDPLIRSKKELIPKRLYNQRKKGLEAIERRYLSLLEAARIFPELSPDNSSDWRDYLTTDLAKPLY